MRLTDFSNDVYSQFGEDGIIKHIFDKIGIVNRVCVEFGAGDGLDCSNVANLWRNFGWHAILIESSQARFEELKLNVNKHSNCELHWRRIHARGAGSINKFFLPTDPPDFISIDVDGNDYQIWKEMTISPRVVCVEFNPTIPPHISLYQKEDEELMGFGASLKAFVQLGLAKGYMFVGATFANAFFVRNDASAPFEDYERDLMKLFPLEGYAFLITDFTGRALGVGKKPAWGVRTPYVGPAVVGDYFSLVTETRRTLDAWIDKYGTVCEWLQGVFPNIADPDSLAIVYGNETTAREFLVSFMENKRSPLCIPVDMVSDFREIEWVQKEADTHNYNCRTDGGVLTLTRGVE